ncbi:MAG: LysM peptidoglycan-binding domain-containing protein, partial [Cyanobacteria bacterium K_DeepCast_35m_m1_288]|nr:LysM peptidoglycan-binding domain-containing protein [Cyanobacteria bacterium K_DeepCast_35m_m1_288]
MQRRHRVLALASAFVLIGSTPARGQTRTITVVEGDTLEQLALRYRVDLQALIELNGIRDPTLLQVGEVLKLPEARGARKRSS